MATQISPVFKGFRGSVNRQLLFRQCAGKTIVSRFPDRSQVIYSERQKMARKRFSEAVDFARVVIKEPGLKDIYSIRASLLGFRSAWNLAIAEFMSDEALGVKKRKIRFERVILNDSFGWKVPAKLYRFDTEPVPVVLKVPPRLDTKGLRRRLKFGTGSSIDVPKVKLGFKYLRESLAFTQKSG